MKAQVLRKKNTKDLKEFLAEQREHLRDLQFRLSGAQLKNNNELRETKRTIARILTILNDSQKNNE